MSESSFSCQDYARTTGWITSTLRGEDVGWARKEAITFWQIEELCFTFCSAFPTELVQTMVVEGLLGLGGGMHSTECHCSCLSSLLSSYKAERSKVKVSHFILCLVFDLKKTNDCFLRLVHIICVKVIDSMEHRHTIP